MSFQEMVSPCSNVCEGVCWFLTCCSCLSLLVCHWNHWNKHQLVVVVTAGWGWVGGGGTGQPAVGLLAPFTSPLMFRWIHDGVLASTFSCRSHTVVALDGDLGWLFCSKVIFLIFIFIMMLHCWLFFLCDLKVQPWFHQSRTCFLSGFLCFSYIVVLHQKRLP